MNAQDGRSDLSAASRSVQTDSLLAKSTDTGSVRTRHETCAVLRTGSLEHRDEDEDEEEDEEEWDTPNERLWSGDYARCGDTCVWRAVRHV